MNQGLLSEEETLKKLRNVSVFTGEGFPDKESMWTTITKIEKQFRIESSVKIEYMFARSILNYVFAYVRGDERRSYFQSVILHYNYALQLSEGSDTHFVTKENPFYQELSDHDKITLEWEKCSLMKACP